MKSFGFVTAVAVFVMMGGRAFAGAPENVKVADEHMSPLARFAGEWVIDAKWSSGELLHARNSYTWSLGNRILVAKTFVNNGDREYQRYESILAWNPDKKSLDQTNFTFDGHRNQAIIESIDPDTLHIGWVPYQEGQPAPIRQIIQFKGDDAFLWKVMLKEGEGWKQIMEGTWRRVK